MKSSTTPMLKALVAFLLLALPMLTNAQSLICPPVVSLPAISGQCSNNVIFAVTPVGFSPVYYTTSGSIGGGVSGGLFQATVGAIPAPTNLIINAHDATSAVIASCVVSIDVYDNEAPTIICPPDKTVNVDGAPGVDCDALVNLDAPIGFSPSDNCAGVTWSVSPPSATLFSGTTTVTYTASDVAGNSTACETIIVIDDQVDPIITQCGTATDVSMNAGVNTCQITVPDLTGDVLVTENCPAYTIAQSPADGSFLTGPDGTVHTITFTVTDAGGRTVTCAAAILTSVDDVAPIVTCPAEATVSADAGVCEGTYAGGTETATDNCGTVAPATITGNGSGLATGDFLTYEVTDAVGNTATCTQTVVVTDDIDPTISCPADETVDTDAGVCTHAYTAGTPATFDNCGGEVVSTSSLALVLGANTVTYTVTDLGGLTAACDQTVTVEDNEDPTITCPADATVNTDADVCTGTYTGVPVAGADNCSIATSTVAGDGAALVLGDNTVTYTVTDGAGLTAACDQTITVTDIVSPTAPTCPASMNIVASPTCFSVVPDFATSGDVVFDDNCAFAVTQDVPAATQFGPNETAPYDVTSLDVTVTATDLDGNVFDCVVELILDDQEAPSATCQDVTLTLDANGVVSVFDVDLDVNSNDYCNQITFGFSIDTDGDLPLDYETSLGALNGAGSELTCAEADGAVTPYIMTVTDDAGNSATCEATILVEDVDAPTAVCNDVTVSLDAMGAYAEDDVTTVDPIFFGGLFADGSYDNCQYGFAVSRDGDPFGSSIAFDCADVNTPVVVTLEVTDAQGLNSTCTATVTVEDLIAPVVTDCPVSVPTPIALTVDAACEAFVDMGTLDITDNCALSFSYDLGLGGGSVAVADLATAVAAIEAQAYVHDPADGADPTLYTVSVLVDDVNGNLSSCDVDIAVSDAVAPTAICQDITVDLDASGMVSIAASDVDNGSSDQCGGAVDLITTSVVDFTCAELGSANVVELEVVDVAGNTATCNATVTVEDNIVAVVANCPASPQALDIDATCEAFADMGTLDITDNCGLTFTYDLGLGAGATAAADLATAIAAVQAQAYVHNPADATNPTEYTITLTATDNNADTYECVVDIEVSDDEAPTPVCQDITVALVGNSVTVAAADVDGGSSDQCGGTVTFSTLSTTTFGCATLGDHTVTLIVTDVANNTATCAATVTVEDTTPPTITCPANIVTNTDPNACIAFRALNRATATDNCPGSIPVTFTATSVPVGVTLVDIPGFPLIGNYPAGVSTVVFTATDVNGVSSQCTVTVTVNDVQPPSITCPANVTLNSAHPNCGAPAVWNAPVASDFCSAVSVSSNVTPGTVIAVGAPTTVTYTATAGGLTATCSFTVTVNDTEAPEITCPATTTINNDANMCSAVAYYAAPVGTDNCSGATTAAGVTNVASGAAFPLGTTVNSFTVTDGAGLTKSCTFSITVLDTQAPAITCPANITASTDAGICTAAVTWTGTIATDNCATPTVTASVPNGSNFATGAATTVTLTATDAVALTATCSFTVTVNDMEAPAITCPAAVAVGTDAGVCGATVTFVAPVGTDNCAGAVTAAGATNVASGAVFPVGVTTNSYTVTDLAGATAACSFDVTVTDTELPTITCPAAIVTEVAAGTCAADVTWTGTVAADNCAATVTASVANGSSFAAGVNTVTLTATDAATLAATCSFTVTVNLPTAAAVATAATCNGTMGSIDLTTTGSPFVWSNGEVTEDITAVAGTYTVSVGNASCPVTASATIGEPTAVTASASAVDATCLVSTGSVSVVAGGGNGAYTYTWTPSGAGASSTGLAAGTYTVVVTDGAGCMATATATIAASGTCTNVVIGTAYPDNITPNSATIHWTAQPCATGYKVQYRTNLGGGVFGPWTLAPLTGGGTNSYTATSLVPFTRYQFRIYTQCNGAYLATWTLGNFITTANIYADVDGDDFGDGASVTVDSIFNSSTQTFVAGDCNDTDATINPTATEICDGIDQNCNGTTDEGVTTTFYADADGDTYGALASTVQACAVPAGYVANSTDCNDAAATAFPGGVETCDGLDNDCNGTADDGAYACPIPSGVSISNITATAATMSWTGALCAKSYNVSYRRNDQATIIWTYFNVNHPTVSTTISGLTPGKTYRVRMRSKCQNNALSALTTQTTFTTLSTPMIGAEEANTPEAIEAAKATAKTPEFSISPNPGRDVFHVQVSDTQDQDARLRVMDAYGKTVMTWNTSVKGGSVNEMFNLSDLPAGVYFIKVELAEGSITKSFIKE